MPIANASLACFTLSVTKPSFKSAPHPRVRLTIIIRPIFTPRRRPTQLLLFSRQSRLRACPGYKLNCTLQRRINTRLPNLAPVSAPIADLPLPKSIEQGSTRTFRPQISLQTGTMGGSISKMMNKIFGSKEMRLLMLGLDAAGKTSAYTF